LDSFTAAAPDRVGITPIGMSPGQIGFLKEDAAPPGWRKGAPKKTEMLIWAGGRDATCNAIPQTQR
jgi:hypothetical protein